MNHIKLKNAIVCKQLDYMAYILRKLYEYTFIIKKQIEISSFLDKNIAVPVTCDSAVSTANSQQQLGKTFFIFSVLCIKF